MERKSRIKCVRAPCVRIPIRAATEAVAALIARQRRVMFDEIELASGDALDRVERDTRLALVHAMREGYYRHGFATDDELVVAGAGVIIAR